MILPQVAPINTSSLAYQWGQRDALAGSARKPERVFTGRQDQDNYAAGVASVTKPAPVAPIVVPQLKRNTGREYVRKTDSLCYEQQVKLIEAQQSRYDKMLALTAAFLGPDAEPDMIFMAV